MTQAELFGIFTTVATVVGATWALRSKLGDIEHALTAYVTKLEDITTRVIKLEKRRPR